MKLSWIGDVNKPGNYPQGGWWRIIDSNWYQVSPNFETREEALEWLEDRPLE